MKKILITLFLASIAIHSFAQETNIDADKKKVELCVSCHNYDGNSRNPAWPKIAQQNIRYLIKQMLDFQQGEDGPRYDATMSTIMAQYDLEDIEEMAAYYASQKVTVGVADEALLERGRLIYRGGRH